MNPDTLAPVSAPETSRRWLLRAVSGLLALLLLGVHPLAAQSDSAARPPAARVLAPRATLQGWAEATWYLLEDRTGARDGRLSRAGILQRFHENLDDEYQLDLISSPFSLSDEYEWYARETGVRYWAGSINHRDMITGGDFKAWVRIAEGWRGRVTFRQEETPVLDRNLFRVGVFREWESGAVGFLEGSLHEVKPDMDLGAGAGWRGERVRGSLSVMLLDVFSDFIYQELGIWPGFARTAMDYKGQPLAVRGWVEVAASPRLRVEGHGAFLFPARLRAYDQVVPDSGFHQEERFGYAAGLVEWSPSPELRAGGYASVVQARVERTPLPAGSPRDDFSLTERTARAGAFMLARPRARWLAEGWVERSWRPERREARRVPEDQVDYLERAWSGSVLLGYRAPSGFAQNTAFDFDLRKAVRGLEQVPRTEPYVRDNTRLRFDLGWEAPGRWAVFAGTNFDVDNDPPYNRPRFDGAHGRFVLYW